MGLRGSGFTLDWGSYNAGHSYEATITGSGSPVGLFFADTQLGDNVGSFRVEFHTAGGVSTPPVPYTPPSGPDSKSDIGSEDDYAAGGSPGEKAVTTDPIRYADGAIVYASTDLSSSAFGGAWVHTRTWTDSGSDARTNPNGAGMISSDQPWIYQVSDGSLACVVLGGTDQRWFSASGESYTPLSFLSDTLIHDTADSTFIFRTTRGEEVRFFDFNAAWPEQQRGLVSRVVRRGQSGTPGADFTMSYTDGKLASVSSVDANGVGDTFAYSYIDSGINAGRLETIELLRKDSESSAQVTVSRATYTYYGVDDPNGMPGELRTATITDGTNQTIATKYYRYYVSTTGPTSGHAGALKYTFDGPSYDRLSAAVSDIATAPDAVVAPYADNYYEYDSARRVTRHDIRGFGGDDVSGIGEFAYSYWTNPSSVADGPNVWRFRTTETLRDGNQNIIYTNANAEVMLKVFYNTADTAAATFEGTFYRFDSEGRIIWEAGPSAVDLSYFTNSTALAAGLEQYPDLMHEVAGNYVYIHDDSGAIAITDYYTSTTYGISDTVVGGVLGYVQNRKMQHGELATSILLGSQEYFAQTGGGVTVYPVAQRHVYANEDGTGIQTTTYSYAWLAGTVQPEWLSVTAPAVTAGQNGSGVGSSEQVWFDDYGQAIWNMDAAGYLTYKKYDPSTGRVLQRIDDASPALVDDSRAKPIRNDADLPTALHLVTNREVDPFGRVTMRQDPNLSITYKVYSADGHEQRVYRGWTGTTTTGPIEIRLAHPRLGDGEFSGAFVSDFLTLSAVPAKDANDKPTGAESITSDHIQSLVRTWVNTGGQVVATQAYFSLAGLSWAGDGTGLGSASNTSATGHYHETQYGYDERGRLARVQSPSGTITHAFYDGMGRITSTWTGLDDEPDSDVDLNEVLDWRDFRFSAVDSGEAPTGVDLAESSAAEYDISGNLVRSSLHRGGSLGDIITLSLYDWRNRLTNTKSGASLNASEEDGTTNRQIMHYDYDSLGNITGLVAYDGDQIAMVDTNGDGEVDGISDSIRRSLSKYFYDARNQMFKGEQHLISQATGSDAGTGTQLYWYDARGYLIKSKAGTGLVEKYRYDGTGRVVASYVTDGGSDSQWSDAANVDSDVVLQQSETTYDTYGNVILTTVRERFHDETLLGALGTPTAGVKARVTYAAAWYDATGRLTASADVGTNGGAVYTRPGAVPAPSDTVLVTSYDYDAGGRLSAVTDPRGITSRTYYDMLGRAIRVVEAYTDGVASADDDRTTEFLYNGNGQLLSETHVNVVAGGSVAQTTSYAYAVRNMGGLNSNDVLSSITYPGAGTETFTYDLAGNRTSYADRNNTVHQYGYDPVGRLVSDTVAQLGTGVDGSVRRIGYGYDALGNVSLFTSYADTGGTSIVNQVKRTFNGDGLLQDEYQSTSGAVVIGITPVVSYRYSTIETGRRLERMIYPNGRVLRYEYNTGTDRTIGRISYMADQAVTGEVGAHLEEYSYLGLGTIVERRHPEVSTNLTYIGAGTGEGGDKYVGLDRFGRVIDQRWVKGGTTDMDRFQYGYDRNGNVQYKKNMVDGSFSELYHASGAANGYDPLNRLASFSRGVLSAGNDTIANPSTTNTWSLDAMGNWASLGAVNSENQLTTNGVTYDANGNMTTDHTSKGFVYNAWNQLVTVKSANGTAVMGHWYDGLGRRVSANNQKFYYSSDWQIIQDESSMTLRQYVWSVAYVDAMVLRDFNSDGNMATGNQGKAGSGLDQRIYPMQDANWNVTGLVGDVPGSGIIVRERYVYDPYGQVTVLKADWSAATNPTTPSWAWYYLHQGGRWDATAGLYHFRNRDYSPTLGRWMTQDPLGYVDGGSLYQAYRSGPVGGVDPWGLAQLILGDESDANAPRLDRSPYGGHDLIIRGKRHTQVTVIVDTGLYSLDRSKHDQGHVGVAVGQRYFDFGPVDSIFGGPGDLYWANPGSWPGMRTPRLSDIMRRISPLSKGNDVWSVEAWVLSDKADALVNYWERMISSGFPDYNTIVGPTCLSVVQRGLHKAGIVPPTHDSVDSPWPCDYAQYLMTWMVNDVSPRRGPVSRRAN